MNEISKDIKTHWVITHSGSHHQITAGQEANLVNIGLDDLVKIDDSSIKGSAIAEVLSNEMYRLTYPEKQSYGQTPQDYNYPITQNGKSMTERLTEWYEKHPEKKNSKGYKFFQEHKLGYVNKGEEYKAKRQDFDPKKETWEQFKERVWVNN